MNHANACRMKTLRDLLHDATLRLQVACVYSPDADAEIIISTILNISRKELKQRLDQTIEDISAIEQAVAQREQRIPIARIFGQTLFRDITIKTGEGVFEPCIETETLIEHLHLALEKQPKTNPRILDIGTGTGCLLLSALKEIPDATGVGVDIAGAAVALAKENAAANGVADRVEFRVSNWIDQVVPETFDIVLCNPPFVPSDLIKTLVPEVKLHDPHASLDGGKDGLRFYRQLTEDFLRVSHEGSIGILHVSMTFIEQVKHIFQTAGYQSVEVCRNYYGVPMGLIVLRDSYCPKVSLMDRLLRFF